MSQTNQDWVKYFIVAALAFIVGIQVNEMRRPRFTAISASGSGRPGAYLVDERTGEAYWINAYTLFRLTRPEDAEDSPQIKTQKQKELSDAALDEFLKSKGIDVRDATTSKSAILEEYLKGDENDEVLNRAIARLNAAPPRKPGLSEDEMKLFDSTNNQKGAPSAKPPSVLLETSEFIPSDFDPDAYLKAHPNTQSK